MEEKKKLKRPKRIISRQVEDTMFEINPKNLETRNCWGWKDTMEAASDVFSSIHSSLLAGDFIFGYKNIVGVEKSNLAQLVVVRFRKGVSDFGTQDCSEDMFGVGVITSGYSMLLPRVPLDYIESELINDMIKWKIEKNILNTFKQVIEDIKNETTCN